MEKAKKTKQNTAESDCTTCEYFVWDEFLGENVCGANLDEDEYYRMVSSSRCPFYKFYDEYKTVQRQN